MGTLGSRAKVLGFLGTAMSHCTVKVGQDLTSEFTQSIKPGKNSSLMMEDSFMERVWHFNFSRNDSNQISL